MDIFSHGLWGGIAFGRKSKKMYWWSFFFGIMPDLFSFGILTAATILGLSSGPNFGHGLPDPAAVPHYIHILYNITHSLIVFAFVFAIVWFLHKKHFLPLLAWGFHILIDIPTHSVAFFPTPFLWPISNFMVNGISWGQPIILVPDLILLVICYFIWWLRRRRKME